MQDAIYQLERAVDRLQAAQGMEHTTRGSQPQVAIYNEDDLSDLLFDADRGHHEEAHAAAGHEGKLTLHHLHQLHQLHQHHQHHQHHDLSDLHLLDHHSSPSGTHSPRSDTSESAILSDCEDDDADDENVIPPSPSRPRGGSICSDTAECPVFLGRQAAELAASPRRLSSSSSSSSSSSPQPTREEELAAPKPLSSCLRRGHHAQTDPRSGTGKHVQLVLPEQHVAAIEGPMMSWWPEPLETMEHEWTDDSVSEANAREKKVEVVPVEQHVSEIEGPLMSWWPSLHHEWSDLFYE